MSPQQDKNNIGWIEKLKLLNAKVKIISVKGF